MNHHPVVGLAASLALLALLGCAEASRQPAVTPPPEAQQLMLPGGEALLGAYDLFLDPTTLEAEIVPTRSASLAVGDVLNEVGLTFALQGMFGVDAVRPVAVRRNGGLVEVDFETTHPFDPSIRPDLGIFNLKIVLLCEGTEVHVDNARSDPRLVANADGYSDMWLSLHFDTNTGGITYPLTPPYVIVQEDRTSPSFDFTNPVGWNHFFPGEVSVDTVQFDLSGPAPVHYQMLFTANYGKAADRFTRLTPNYQLPKFAGCGAWKIAVSETSNDLIAGTPSSTASYAVDIWDWTHGAGLGWDIDRATITIPDVVGPTPLTLTLSGTGTDPTPLTAAFGITNAQSAPAGDYWGLVGVYLEDLDPWIEALHVSFTGQVLTNGYTTYQWFPVHVDPVPAFPPTAAFTRCFTNPLPSGAGDRFDASTSTPGTNPITTYEWDFEYDGVTFDVDATGITTGHVWTVVGPHTMALRVTDSIALSDIETLAITVTGTAAWSAPLRLTTNSLWDNATGGTAETTNALAIAADGSAHMVYSDVTPTLTTSYYHEYLGCPPAWQPRIQIAQINGPGSNVAANTSIVITPDQTLHVMLPVTTTNPQFRYTQRPLAGAWSPEVFLTTQPPGIAGRWTSGYLAVNGAGALGFCGQINRSPSEICQAMPAPPSLTYFKPHSAGVWGPDQLVGSHHVVTSTGSVTCPGSTYSTINLPQLAFAGTGASDWVAVWCSNAAQYMGGPGSVSGNPAHLEWNRTTGGVWAGSDSLLYSGGVLDDPALCRAPNGDTWLIAKQAVAPTLLMSKYAGGSWNAALTPVYGSGSQGTSNLYFDTAGGGWLISSNGSLRAKRFSQTDSVAAAVGMPDQIIEALSVARQGAQIAGGADGRALAVWSTDKYGGGPFVARELDASTLQ